MQLTYTGEIYVGPRPKACDHCHRTAPNNTNIFVWAHVRSLTRVRVCSSCHGALSRAWDDAMNTPYYLRIYREASHV